MLPFSPKTSLLRLQRFCFELGWDAPLVTHRTPEELHDRRKPSLMRYFYSMYEMDSPIYVQINPQTDQHPRLYAIGVYAMRYRFCTGWHGFMLDRNLRSELEKVKPWAQASIFSSQRGRRIFREAHPECTGYTWQRIRDSELPYTQNSTYNRWLKHGFVEKPVRETERSFANEKNGKQT